MKWVAPCWQALGIAPTADIRDIRRAYAAKLKAIDVESDPQAFIALREVFEAAQHQAQWVDREDADDPGPEPEEDVWCEEFEHRGETPVAFRSHWTDAPSPSAAKPAHLSPWPSTPEDYDARAGALAALLLNRDDGAAAWPDDAESAKMLDLWRVIASDPRMQEISFLANAEQWFAELIARACPFSDPLVRPVSAYFNWLATAGQINQSPAVTWVATRCQTLDFLDAIRDPQHKLHAAYLELTKPATERSRRGWVNRAKVRTLLATVRAHFPDLEGSFDSYRVALWDGTAAKGGLSVWAIVWLIWMAILIARNCSDPILSTRSPTAPSITLTAPELADQRADIRTLLGEIGDGSLTEEQLSSRNPLLAQLLRSNWEIAKSDGRNRDQYIDSMSTLLRERAANQLWVSSNAILFQYQQLVIDEAKVLHRAGADECAGFFKGEPVLSRLVPPDITARHRALISRTLLETTEEPREAKRAAKFHIPGPIFEAATKRAGLRTKQMQDALLGRGSDEQVCKAQIALRETVLQRHGDAAANQLLREL